MALAVIAGEVNDATEVEHPVVVATVTGDMPTFIVDRGSTTASEVVEIHLRADPAARDTGIEAVGEGVVGTSREGDLGLVRTRRIVVAIEAIPRTTGAAPDMARARRETSDSLRCKVSCR